MLVNLKASFIHLTLQTGKISLNRSARFMYKLYQQDFRIRPTYVFFEKLSQDKIYCLSLVPIYIGKINLIKRKYFPLKSRNRP